MPNKRPIDLYLHRWGVVERESVSKFVHVKSSSDLSGLNIDFSEYTIDEDRFEAFYERHSYKKIPEYVNSPYEAVVVRKALEHYISLDVVSKELNGSSIIDIASSHSPFGRIARKEYQFKDYYKQDLSYPSGINGEMIGGDAAAMGLPDGSIDYMFLHNSWEHFEGFSDIAFLFEASRLLRKNGKVVIIPLDILSAPICATSPSFWMDSVGKETMKWPVFDSRFKISIEEGIKQRLIKRHTLSTLNNDISEIKNLVPTIVSITNPDKYKFQKNFMMLNKR
tara:strand:- start:3974 stop:4813 length:840 start_codon:yes stop_codon:yes gene_type:complete